MSVKVVEGRHLASSKDGHGRIDRVFERPISEFFDKGSCDKGTHTLGCQMLLKRGRDGGGVFTKSLLGSLAIVSKTLKILWELVLLDLGSLNFLGHVGSFTAVAVGLG